VCLWQKQRKKQLLFLPSKRDEGKQYFGRKKREERKKLPFGDFFPKVPEGGFFLPKAIPRRFRSPLEKRREKKSSFVSFFGRKSPLRGVKLQQIKSRAFFHPQRGVNLI
jgi:hypothetical protein